MDFFKKLDSKTNEFLFRFCVKFYGVNFEIWPYNLRSRSRSGAEKSRLLDNSDFNHQKKTVVKQSGLVEHKKIIIFKKKSSKSRKK